MVLTETALLYGFGSFFRNAQRAAADIDILILHESVAPSSINFAIECKRLLRARIPMTDIVMLSEGEEREIKFLDRSEAIFLGHLASDGVKDQVDLLLVTLRSSNSATATSANK